MGVGSGMGIGMTGSGTGSDIAGAAGEYKFLPPMCGDRGLPASEGGRVPPKMELRVVGGPPTADPEVEPDTDAGSGTRDARLLYEPRLLFVLERGVGGAGYWTFAGTGASAYAGVDERVDSLRVRAGGVVSESTEPMPDDTLEDSSSSCRLIAERVYGCLALRLEPADCELLLDGWSGMTTGGPSPPGKPPGMPESERTDDVAPKDEGGRGTPAGPTVLLPNDEDGRGTPAGPMEVLLPIGDGGPVGMNPEGSVLPHDPLIITGGGMTGLVAGGGCVEGSGSVGVAGNGRSASSALRKKRCGSPPSVLEMFDSGREGGSTLKVISFDDTLPLFCGDC